jgi:hypothetical protein
VAVAIAAAVDIACVTGGAQRGGQFLFDGNLDRAPHCRVDQFAERAGAAVMRPLPLPDILSHGASHRWPPCQAARW